MIKTRWSRSVNTL